MVHSSLIRDKHLSDLNCAQWTLAAKAWMAVEILVCKICCDRHWCWVISCPHIVASALLNKHRRELFDNWEVLEAEQESLVVSWHSYPSLTASSLSALNLIKDMVWYCIAIRNTFVWNVRLDLTQPHTLTVFNFH